MTEPVEENNLELPAPPALALQSEWQAAVGEGHCPDCLGRLRPLTDAEQSLADLWWRAPIGVCSVCCAVISVVRVGQPDQPEPKGTITGVSWRTNNPRDPFYLEEGP